MQRVYRETANKIVWLPYENETQQKHPTNAYDETSTCYRAKRTLRKRWLNNIKGNMKKQGNSATEATHLALVRKLKLPPLQLTTGVHH